MNYEGIPDTFADFRDSPSAPELHSQAAASFDSWNPQEMSASTQQAGNSSVARANRDETTIKALGWANGDGTGSQPHLETASASMDPERVGRSTQDRDDRVAELLDEAVRKEAKSAAHWEMVERRDADFHTTRLYLGFTIQGATEDGAIEEDCSPARWALRDHNEEDDAENARLRENLEREVVGTLAPWVSHYRSLGLVRADFASFSADGGLGDAETGATFYLVHRAAEADLCLDELAQLPAVRVELSSLPGATLSLSVQYDPTNATMLFDALQRGGGGTGQWGGDATPQLTPAPNESRGEWLERVCLSRARLERLVTRWRRSGGNLDLFKASGAASGQVALDRPIEWIVPGLFPRGYVSLLVGTKQAGKSTLLGEMLAVVDSECEAPRHFLGTEISARGVSALVSGEDGIDFVAARNRYYEPVHGPAGGFVFVTAERPWVEVLRLLYGATGVSLVGIDGLRAVMPGDEDSSGAVSQFLNELNALARYHNCAIVLIHHLSKGKVRSLSGMLQAVRGSGAITDRVRVAVGMIDRGSDVTEVGIIKHNIPPSETLWGEINQGRLFRRDAASLSLVPIGQVGSERDAPSNDVPSSAVADAIRHFNAIGITLRQTGKSELFAQRFSPLSGVSRHALRNAVASLIETGQVIDGPDGLRIAVAA